MDLKFYSTTMVFLIVLFLTSCGVSVTLPTVEEFRNDKIDFTREELTDSLNHKLKTLASKNETLGFGVAIVNKDRILFQNGFGKASNELGSPFTTQTVMPIGSISKTLIGVCLMKAVELGNLKLNDDINKYLPFDIVNPHQPNQLITIKHLATHTSGLKYTKHYDKSYIPNEKFPTSIYDNLNGTHKRALKRELELYNSNQEMSMTAFLKKIYHVEGEWYSKQNFLKEGSGKKHNYCNENAAFAALVIESATGLNYKDFVAQYILEPLQMNSSGWSLSEFESNQRGQLYLNSKPIPIYDLITYPDGSFVTCIDDFTRYFHALMRGFYGEDNIISSSSYQEFMKVHHTESTQGAGIFIEMDGEEIGHTGGDPGLITFAKFSKETGYGYLLFLNRAFLCLFLKPYLLSESIRHILAWLNSIVLFHINHLQDFRT